ncbi:hypothetical protein KKG81_04820 [bacterium]|nr:hypothetical protein [bacterium]
MEQEETVNEEEQILEEFGEETAQENGLQGGNVVLQDVNLDDIDDTPESEKYNKIGLNTEIEAGKTLTIENIKIGKPILKDKKGELIQPEINSNGNGYYKAKLIVMFKEEIDGNKIREFVPSVFYGVSDIGEINQKPIIPKTAAENKLEDNFTSELAKLRFKYCRFVKKLPKDVSSQAFLKGMIGKKVSVEKISDEFKGKKWAKLKIIDFVQ